ncbi:hypothetical protein [Pseudovibrio sp. Ad37]|uniref:hypothetical protein n=1 Tax=Pseudovibrio sp. Ad37 TaxID=989422 RepID=UPI0007AE991A|nr:hypothetical protein [Pseudovibrio sp. Ad37]KZL26496.1 hypothetical protein PsAD37_01817 [Pseudovibrio sp. Ad37]
MTRDEISFERLIKEIECVNSDDPVTLNVDFAATTLKTMIDQGYEDHGIEDPVLARYLLEFIGIAGGEKYKDLVSECLASTQHLDVARTALIIIYEKWDKVEDFIDDIYALLIGVPWDPSGYLRYQAILAVSRLSKDHPYWPKISEILHQISEDDVASPELAQKARIVLEQ